MTTIFISYSHRDDRWRDELESVLRIMTFNNAGVSLAVWSDKKLAPGDPWEQKIDAIMERASIAVLILTRNFLASEFIRRKELPYLEKRAETGQLRIVPVLAEPCPWDTVPALRRLQVRPTNGQALVSLAESVQQEELDRFYRDIAALISDETPGPPPPPEPTTETARDVLPDGAVLELSFRHQRTARYSVEAQYSLPSGKHRALRYPVHLERRVLGDCGSDLDSYASELRRRIFPAGPALELLEVAGERGDRRSLKLRISVNPSASELHEINWEALAHALHTGSTPEGGAVAFVRHISSGQETWPKPVIRSWPRVRIGLYDFRLARPPVALDEYEEVFGAAGLHCSRFPEAAPLASLDPEIPVTLISSDLTLDSHAMSLTWPDASGKLVQRPAEDAAEACRRYLRRAQVLILDTLPAVTDTGDVVSGTQATLRLAADFASQGFCAAVACAAPMKPASWKRFLQLFLDSLSNTGNVDAAANHARAGLADRDEAWKPVVFTRLRTGQVWFRPRFIERAAPSWQMVVDRVREGMVVPIVGPAASEYLIRSRAETAELLADRSHFPLARSERSRLRKVTQYIATTRERASVIRQVLAALRSHCASRYATVVHQLPDNVQPRELMDRLWADVFADRPDNPYRLLARMRAPIYLTTIFHDFLSSAIRDELTTGDDQVSSAPQDRIWSLDKGIVSTRSDGGQAAPGRVDPIVHYMFGRLDQPDSLILTEDDHFRFLLDFKEAWRSLPEEDDNAFTDSALLFLGFDLESWDFRTIFRAFLELGGSQRLRQIPHVAVQIDPDDDRLTDPIRTRDYLVQYFRQISEKPLVYLGSALDFLTELERRLAQ